MRYFRLFFVLVLTGVLLVMPAASAATAPKNKGLLISPLKSYTTIDAGAQKTSSFTVANFTDRPITVDLSVKQFSVSDYAYNFDFSEPRNKWVMLPINSVDLKPNENKKVQYVVQVPTGSAPGGYYYTLFASANLSSSGLASTVRAASLLYLTVNGKLIQTSTTVNSGIKHFVYKNDIPYFIDVSNTGNVHYFANFTGTLRGLFVRIGPVGTSHLLLPGSTRHVVGSIPSPVLPGLYKARYGYKTDANASFTASSYILYVPPWSVAVLLLALFAGYKYWRYRRIRGNQEI